jgi:predicted Rossmann fold nucleotide-binding protein DprA/Smf involved in DNA uptake
VPKALQFTQPDSDVETALQWLALALTPGLGPTKARRLVERFGGIQGVHHATLTELEAAGIQAVSAQALGTGRSLEMAQDELARASAEGIHVLSFEDAAYPPPLKQIYDPPLVLIYTRRRCGIVAPRDRGPGHSPSHAVWDRNG